MKTRQQWIDEAQLEIIGYRNAGEELTKEAVRQELTVNYGDPDMAAVIDAEGGIDEYLETLWMYIEKELENE